MNRCHFWIRCLLVVAATVGMTFICSPQKHGLFETTWAKTPAVQDFQASFPFQHNSSRYNDKNDDNKLDEVGLRMKQDPGTLAQIVGYKLPDEKDSPGGFGGPLAELRAQTIKNILVTRHGIDPSRITTTGKECLPEDAEPGMCQRSVLTLRSMTTTELAAAVLEAMKPKPQPPQVVRQATIVFPLNSPDIDSDLNKEVERKIEEMRPDIYNLRIEVYGYARPDEHGPNGESVKWLAQARAEAVETYLLKSGVDRGHIKISSTELCRAKGEEGYNLLEEIYRKCQIADINLLR